MKIKDYKKILSDNKLSKNKNELYTKEYIEYQRIHESLSEYIENSGLMDKIEVADRMVTRLKKLKKLQDLKVYLTTFKRANGDVVVMAKTNWFDELGNKKSEGVYCGNLESFTLGVKDPIALQIGKDKMLKKLRKELTIE